MISLRCPDRTRPLLRHRSLRYGNLALSFAITASGTVISLFLPPPQPQVRYSPSPSQSQPQVLSSRPLLRHRSLMYGHLALSFAIAASGTVISPSPLPLQPQVRYSPSPSPLQPQVRSSRPLLRHRSFRYGHLLSPLPLQPQVRYLPSPSPPQVQLSRPLLRHRSLRYGNLPLYRHYSLRYGHLALFFAIAASGTVISPSPSQSQLQVRSSLHLLCHCSLRYGTRPLHRHCSLRYGHLALSFAIAASGTVISYLLCHCSLRYGTCPLHRRLRYSYLALSFAIAASGTVISLSIAITASGTVISPSSSPSQPQVRASWILAIHMPNEFMLRIFHMNNKDKLSFSSVNPNSIGVIYSLLGEGAKYAMFLFWLFSA